MRKGFTTGSCATAASKAAACMLLGGNIKKSISITTPSGTIFNADIDNIEISENQVSCSVIKDGGDDIDVTTGLNIFATVSLSKGNERKVTITGGKGIGKVTRIGLNQSVGNFAINSVPREMITKEVLEVMDLFDYEGNLSVEISAPGGEDIAMKTFNPRLGIEGGISILGTSGIVEPMSQSAIKETIRIELNQKRMLGQEIICLTPGNYGLAFMKNEYDFNLDKAVKCSNFIGDSIDIATELGFKKILLVGHIGKLIKISGGIMNTHSKVADCRLELMAAACLRCGMEKDTINHILNCNTTQEAIDYLNDNGGYIEVCNSIMDRIMFYLNKRTEALIECVMYSNENGLLGKSQRADEFLEEIKEWCR